MKKIMILFIFLLTSISLFGRDINNYGNETLKKQEHENVRIWKEDSQKLLSTITLLRKFKKDNNDTEIQTKYKMEQLTKNLNEINKKYAGTTLQLNKVKAKDVKEGKVFSAYGRKKMFLAVNKIHSKATGRKIATEKEIRIIFKKGKRLERLIKNRKHKSPMNKKTILSHFTKREQKIFKYIGTLLNNPLYQMSLILVIAGCDKCYKKTGTYEVSYTIPIPDSNGGYNEYNNGIFLGGYYNENDLYNTTMKFTIVKIISDKSEALNIRKGSIQPLTGRIKRITYDANQFNEKTEIIIE